MDPTDAIWYSAVEGRVVLDCAVVTGGSVGGSSTGVAANTVLLDHWVTAVYAFPADAAMMTSDESTLSIINEHDERGNLVDKVHHDHTPLHLFHDNASW